MKPWTDLTDVGKARRLRPLVADALLAYGIKDARIRLLEVATNVVFRADAGGASYAMKVDVEDDFPDEHVNTSLEWLATLGRDTDIPVVELVQTRDGSNFTKATVDHVPPDRRCTLYRWARGRTIFDNPTSDLYRRLGALSARLHDHAASYTPTAEPIRWDKVLYFPNDEYVIESPEYESALTPEMRAVTLEAMDAVAPILASLYETPGRLIHADLHGWNVNVYRGALTILDFDDVMWGQPVHDIAISFGYRRDDPEYPAWIRAYQEGYESISPWPVTSDELIPALMVARRLMFTNYVLTLSGDWSEELTTWEEDFKQWLASR